MNDNLNDTQQHHDHEKDIVLTHKEAKAASPDDFSVCGEEDPGEGLEGLVERNNE